MFGKLRKAYQEMWKQLVRKKSEKYVRKCLSTVLGNVQTACHEKWDIYVTKGRNCMLGTAGTAFYENQEQPFIKEGIPCQETWGPRVRKTGNSVLGNV